MESTYQLAKWIIKPPMKLWFRWHIEGMEQIPRRGAAILAVNHIAYLDPFAAAYVVDAVKRRPRFLAKQELFDDKRVAWILRGAGQIPVRRGTRDAPMALDHALEAVRKGEIVVIFPEGTITTDPDLHPMEAKSGIARLAIESGAPVIPCALWGTANVWGKGYRKKWWPPKQDICVQIGEPMSFGDRANTIEAWRKVGAEIMDRIAVLVAGLRPIVPDRRRPKKAA